MPSHHIAVADEPRDPGTEQRNARVGLRLFWVYLAFYLGFVSVNAFAPSVMDTVLAGGLNVAVVSGFALILGAAILALVYAYLCRKPHGAAR